MPQTKVQLNFGFLNNASWPWCFVMFLSPHSSTHSPPSEFSPTPSTQTQPFLAQRNDGGHSTQDVELDEIPRASRSVVWIGFLGTYWLKRRDFLRNRSPAPSILQTIGGFSILRNKSSLSKQDTISQGEAATEPGDDEISYAWVKPVVICALSSSLIAAINIILTIAALLQWRTKYGDSPVAVGSLYEGSCSLSKRWATGLHVMINILSTLLLGASNYCMQCLSAPSRADVDSAHAKRTWLDIGTSSLRNLQFVNRRRKTLWFILLVTSTPIHLLWVSV